jgi:CheY-like chemotaxis protein
MNQSIRVLMVDDEAQFRATTQKVLKRRGLETILAESGPEAIEKLRERPDVVILDLKMPGMDGHETLREIKDRQPDLPVIMLTGHGEMESAKQALEEGAWDYLSKPCDIDILTGKIHEAVLHGKTAPPQKERSVMAVMIPIEEYTTLTEDHTIQDAINRLKESFSPKVSSDKIMETGHRSLLVYDDTGKVRGILAIADLLRAMMPEYLSSPKPFLADSIQYSPLFWSGMFTREAKTLAKKKIKDVMSPAPLTIGWDSNLMKAAYMMIKEGRRRLAVVKEGKVIGVIREQDLFFEIEKIMRTL